MLMTDAVPDLCGACSFFKRRRTTQVNQVNSLVVTPYSHHASNGRRQAVQDLAEGGQYIPAGSRMNSSIWPRRALLIPISEVCSRYATALAKPRQQAPVACSAGLALRPDQLLGLPTRSSAN